MSVTVSGWGWSRVTEAGGGGRVGGGRRGVAAAAAGREVNPWLHSPARFNTAAVRESSREVRAASPLCGLFVLPRALSCFARGRSAPVDLVDAW